MHCICANLQPHKKKDKHRDRNSLKTCDGSPHTTDLSVGDA